MYRLLLLRRISETQQNEDALQSFADKKEEATLEQLPEYQRFIDELERVEKGSPIYLLSRQKYGESDGILHGGLRAKSAQNRFRLQHMSWRDRAAPARPDWKFQVPEVPFFETMATMPPLWEFRPAAKQVAFKSIDVRSTFSTDALERSYNAHVAIAEKEALLMASLVKTNATRGDLLNTLLRHFLACKSLETTSLGSSAFAEEPDPMAETTHLATSRVGLSVLVANMGNFAGGRKGTLPPKVCRPHLGFLRWKLHHREVPLSLQGSCYPAAGEQHDERRVGLLQVQGLVFPNK